jgi:hypothetical protein
MLVLKGRALMKLGDHARALTCFESALQQQSGDNEPVSSDDVELKRMIEEAKAKMNRP